MDPNKIRYSRFAVNDRPFCVWEWDLKERTTEFLQTADPGYFEYVAQLHIANIVGENARRAAVALRTNYAHGLESFFALLFACFQAPDCVPGWLAKYQLTDLRALVAKVTSCRPFRSKIKLQFNSWEELAAIVHEIAMEEEGERALWRKELGRLWAGFARDFLDEEQSVEYNSLKHGFRVSPGGFILSVGFEPTPGVSPPPEAMMSIGGSQFGSSFFKAEELSQKGRHFRIRRQSRNWIPENHYHGLLFLSNSMDNVLSFLKRARGAEPSSAPMRRPESQESYRYPWRLKTGPVGFNVDTVVARENIKEFTAEEILAIYDSLPTAEE